MCLTASELRPVSHLDLSRAPYVLYGVKYIDLVTLEGEHVPSKLKLCQSQVTYCVKVRRMFCMGLYGPSTLGNKGRCWSIQRAEAVANLKLPDLGRAPYVLYGVKYIDLVPWEKRRRDVAYTAAEAGRPISSYLTWIVRPCFVWR